MTRILAIICVLGAMVSTDSFAQSSDEIVVTASRREYSGRDEIPAIHLIKRADFAIWEVSVFSDTRERAKRNEEIKKTTESLLSIINRNPKLEASVYEEYEDDYSTTYFAVPFTKRMISDATTYGGKEDTSIITFYMKTPIDPAADNVASATKRIEDAVDAVSRVGRAKVLFDEEEFGLSIVNIPGYRQPILNQIAQDTAALRAAFGEEYYVSVSGLEHAVRWRRTAPLDLTLYFPYTSGIYPK